MGSCGGPAPLPAAPGGAGPALKIMAKFYIREEYHYMKVRDIIDILKCQVLNEGCLDEEVKTACGSDMMSDVLAFVKDQSVLLTGLMNPQVVRTAEMMDMHCIIFVRGKEVNPGVVQLAEQKDITVLSTPYRMFTACGLLYSNGLRGGCDIQ